MDPPLLTNPFVSEPVEPADTKGLPPAALGKPQPNEPQEKAYPRSFGKVQRGPGMPRGSDLAIQRTPGTAGMPEPDMNFEGIPSTGVLPPDTNGQVGAEHYVQIVNSGTAGAQVRVWNKETGAQLYDFGLGNLWPSTDPATSMPTVILSYCTTNWQTDGS